MTQGMALHLVKGAHTAIWTFFVIAIVAIWMFAAREEFVAAFWAITTVLVEVAVLGLNHGKCPLGPVAGRLTTDRAANFDIFLPAWIAGRTKQIFGPLCGGGVIFTAFRWATASS